MFTFYLTCLIFGGILILFSLFSGGHSHDIDSHSLDSHDFDSHSMDVDTHIEHSGHHFDKSFPIQSESRSLLSDIGKFFSFRNMLYFVGFFGLTGTIGSILSFNNLLTFLSSIFIGGLAAVFGYSFMKYLKGSQSGDSIDIYDLKGYTAKVTLPVSKTQRGKIIVTIGANTEELIALVSSASYEDRFQIGSEVLIIDFDNKIAIVDKLDI